MILLIFALLSVIAVLVMYIVIGKVQIPDNNGKANENKDSGSELKQKTSLQKLLGIKKIQNSLTISDKDELSCVINISTPDFLVLSESDQEMYENKLIDAVFKLNHDIKIINIVRNITLKDTVERLIDEREKISNDYLYNYSINLEEALISEQEEKVFEKYYVISSSRLKGNYEEKLKDLKYKVNNFVNSMEASGSKAKILTTNELLELQNVLINKYGKLDMKQIEEKGAFEVLQ
mgnify:CR=1 FL=1|jgi:hypothetical protein